MKKKALIFVLVLVLFGYSSLFSQEKRNNCVECHTELGDEYAAIVGNFRSDIHSEKGLSCVNCHGGDSQVEVSEDEPEKAMDPAKGYIGAPDKAEIPDFCGKCHSDPEYMKKFNPNIRIDQVDRYFTSVHGLKLKAGDNKVASCTDCHQSHQTRSKNNPGSRVFPVNISETCGRCHSDTEYMEEYGIPVDQVADYSQSIHYKFLVEDGDLFSPTCNDCHGNHGAVPPGVKSIHNICGTCHFQNNTQFEQSPHAEAFEDMGEPGCSTCHNNHKIERIREEKLGLHELTYVKYETGEREPKVSVIKDFVKLTGVKYDWLFDGIGEMMEDKIQAAFPEITIDETFLRVIEALANPGLSRVIRHKFAIALEIAENEFPHLFIQDKQGERINLNKKEKVLVGGKK